MKYEDMTAIIPGWSSYKIHYPPSGPTQWYSSSPRWDGRFPRWLWFTFGIVVGLLIWWILAPITCRARQTQPDMKRIKQIQVALIDHGYAPGKTWHETQEILRTIAQNHHWQTHRAPDARVLILLGLGNEHSDTDVLTEPKNRLDGGNDEMEK